MTDWKETKISNQPGPLMEIGPGLFMQVRNIEFISEEEGYICETREITASELTLLKHISEMETTIDTINYQLLEML